MNQCPLLDLVKHGATAEPNGNVGVHVKIDGKDLWTDHTESGIDIWTNNGGVNSRAIIDMNMINIVISELQSRLEKQP
jgi:hypothetical protein